MTRTAAPTPPKHLRPATAKWWKKVVAEFELETHHIFLLTGAATAWDRYEGAREALKKHGTVFTDRFGAPRARPEVRIEHDSLIAFARLNRELGLDICESDSAHPRPISARANWRKR